MEEFSWKLLHGDVFRPPKKGMLLSVMLGSGSQIFFMVFLSLGKLAIFSVIINLIISVALGMQ